MTEEYGSLRIAAERGGTIEEITSFLSDLQNAYVALYHLNKFSIDLRRLHRRIPLDMLLDLGYPLSPFNAYGAPSLNPQQIAPRNWLVLSRVEIQSPGFWEVLGSLNPLQQIREYLNDRHKRRQDRDFREAAEKEKLQLENQLIKLQIYEKENSVLRERIAIVKELGYSDADIEQLIWASVGIPMSRLGKHQDTKLIGGSHKDDKDPK